MNSVASDISKGMIPTENIMESQEVSDLKDYMRNIFNTNTVTAAPDLIEFPIGVLISTLSVFIMGAMIAYFYVIRKEQSKKYERETFIFTVDSDKNNYSKKVKFLDQ